jgi:virginiamycin B lyase
MNRRHLLLMGLLVAVNPGAVQAQTRSVSVEKAKLATLSAARIIALDGPAQPQQLVVGDGVIWFSAPRLSAIGRVALDTGDVTFVSLGNGAKPKGLTLGPNGKLYACDGANDVIHQFDPATGDVVRHGVPPGSFVDLGTAAFDGNGKLWFTGLTGYYGSLDPVTGNIEVKPVESGRGPFATTSASDGAVWFASHTGNLIARIDPANGGLEQVAMPPQLQGPKGLTSDRRGNIWVAVQKSGALARYDVATRRWSWWKLPGSGAKPYAVLVDSADRVWVSDTGQDRVLRFNATTARFVAAFNVQQRSMVKSLVERDGLVWAAESVGDRLIAIEAVDPVN